MTSRRTRLFCLVLLLAAILLEACTPSAKPTPAPRSSARLLAAYSERNPPNTLGLSPRPAVPTATPRPEPTPVPAAPKGEERTNILLMGVDERETWSEGPPRTDAMMLVSANRADGTVTVLSIPRDLWVYIPGFGQERVNVAYRVAELTEPGTGPQTAVDTVSQFLDVPISRYVVVNFRAVRKIVEALGGLEVDVPYEIWDYQFPTEDNQYMTVHFPAGRQLLNGEQVLQYVRTRHGSSDFERMRRQQQVLEALQDRVTRPDFIPKVPGFLLLARDCIQTNLSVSDMFSLWSAFGDLNRDAVSLTVLDETYSYPWITTAGADVLLPNEAAIHGLVSELGLRDEASGEEMAQGLQVRLFSNSSQDANFASAAAIVDQAGFTVWQGGVADNPTGHTLVIDYSDGSAGAALAEALGLDDLQVIPQPKPPNLPEDLVADVLLWASETAG
ncbi:MAG: LCP family protein [Anaerolineae bacterium]|jgi:LCP family protein required for cell wall assembly